MRSSIAIAALLLSASHAFCQTAQETVAYLLMGYDGSEVTKELGAGKFTYKPEGTNRDTIVLHVKGSTIDADFVTVKLSSISECSYGVDGKVLNLERFKADGTQTLISYHMEFDFSKAVDIKLASEQYPVTQIAGSKMTCSSDDETFCTQAEQGFFFNVGDPARLTKALDYFKQTYCKGSAF
ncbi:hypothetical protein [Pleomorphomonas koreensis]|uniref:hypothetical protein n=1 Tax=Pleomorphomonas koreensis TaxID=257440 RepID=UPI00047D870B|nr:hypothetical protein [Pleomorphomonas koreensis]